MNKSMGAIIDDWMDMQLSVSPDCLQLSVSMPYLPQNDTKVNKSRIICSRYKKENLISYLSHKTLFAP